MVLQCTTLLFLFILNELFPAIYLFPVKKTGPGTVLFVADFCSGNQVKNIVHFFTNLLIFIFYSNKFRLFLSPCLDYCNALYAVVSSDCATPRLPFYNLINS